MKKQFIMVIALLALVSMMIVPVMAETLTGTLGLSGSVNVTTFSTDVNSAGSNPPISFYVEDIQYTNGLFAVIRFDNNHRPNYNASDIYKGGIQTSFTATIGGVAVGAGTFGYMRSFNPITGVELNGYQYLDFTSWTAPLLGYTGDYTVNFTSGYIGLDSFQGQSNVGIPSGAVTFGRAGAYLQDTGLYYINKHTSFFNDYSATKPSGLGIQGYLFKHDGEGTVYPSKGFVYDGITGQIIVNDKTVNIMSLYFNTQSQSIIIGVDDSYGNHYNSSILFAAAVPTVTPTPTTTIPAGYVRSTFVTIDGVNYNTIHGPNIML